ncbi:Ysp2p [Sugiyamaella lignohabitans]|uniref:Ysp2p n=1 Tax=Sugiyamaella lignohabitans TaxID=796027 RepID=A0A167CLN1_9ASCO|nr:Ysp2p [Sugiyamaella lignohabitans]ANB11860.1 Ysp2p [Sugiyamaella lignohabitans]
MTDSESSSYHHQARGVPFKPSEHEHRRGHRDLLKALSDHPKSGSNGNLTRTSSASSKTSEHPSAVESTSNEDGLSHSESFGYHSSKSEDHSHASSASHFLSSVLTVAQNAANSLAGLKNGEHEESSRSYSEADESESVSEASMSHQRGEDGKLSEVKIEPVRSTISTMGKGELSLATLGFSRDSGSQHRAATPSGEGKKSPQLTDSLKPTSPNANEGYVSGGEGEFNLPEFHSNKFKRSVSITRNRSRRNTNKSMEQPPFRAVSSSTVSTESNEDEDSPEDSVTAFPEGADGDHHLTGFAYANQKRNKEFHRLFKSVQPDDYLLDDFNCALSKEILIQGKMYVSERHVCFNSNILGWVTNLVIAFDEIVTMEKKMTAGLFPNGIVIQTLHARHSFASFVNRDSVIDFLMSIWKKSSPHQPNRSEAYANGSAVNMSDSESTSSTDKERNREVDSDDGSFSYGSSGEVISDELDTDDEFGETARDSPSESANKDSSGGKAPAAGNGSGDGAGADSGSGSGSWPVPLEGPETHAPTDLPALDANDKELATETIHAPLGIVANLLFGSDSTWYKKFLTENQKNIKLGEVPPFEADGGNKTRHYEYVKPLSGPVGPKQTKCISTDTIEKWDLENYVVVTTATSTPDVPSGGSFVTKSRTGLCWAPGNSTKIVISYHIEWSAKSWLKGPIEKGALDGQTQYAKDLVAAINNTLKSKSKSKAPGGIAVTHKKPLKKKRREKVKKVKIDVASAPKSSLEKFMNLLTENPVPGVPLPTWALLTIGIILFSAIRWMFFSPSVPTEVEQARLMRVEEEYQMWKWFEDRGRVGHPLVHRGEGKFDDGDILRYPIFQPGVSSHVKGKKGSYSEQEVLEAIRITEHRLSILKERLNST